MPASRMRLALMEGDSLFDDIVRAEDMLPSAGDPLFGFGAIRKIGRKIFGRAKDRAKRVIESEQVKRRVGAAGRRIRGAAAVTEGACPRRRRRGITSRELRGFHKVARLLHSVGMVPKGTRRRVKRG